MADMKELKECPFCGGQAELIYMRGYEAQCSNLDCPVNDSWTYDSEELATRAWNTRTEHEPCKKMISEYIETNAGLVKQLTQTQQALAVEKEKLRVLRYNIWLAIGYKGAGTGLEFLKEAYAVTDERMEAETYFYFREPPEVEENKRLQQVLDKANADIEFYAKWIERGLFDVAAPKEALKIMFHYPNAPWNNPEWEWDVSHKKYAEEFKAALASIKE